MHITRPREGRLRAHRLIAPAASLVEAAAHMTALQAQEFWGGRWALAVRTRGTTQLGEVDAAFERGELIRAWTMRGTLHILAPRDLDWLLSITAERQTRQYGTVHRNLGIESADIARAERLVRSALAGGNRLTRAEFGAVLAAGGIDPAGMRGNHVLIALCLRRVTCLGPVVPRDGAPSRDQYVVATEDWISETAASDDPLVDLFVRYISGHGPASAADAAWWAGLPVGVMRDAADRAVGSATARVVEVAEGSYVAAGTAPRRHPSAPRVLALPPFEEYYLSYVDRSVPCAPEFGAAIGPTQNGIVRPVIVSDGEIVGVWSHSVAAGKHHLPPRAELFADAPASAVEQALARFARFIAG